MKWYVNNKNNISQLTVYASDKKQAIKKFIDRMEFYNYRVYGFYYESKIDICKDIKNKEIYFSINQF